MVMLDSIRLPQQTIQVSMTSLILGDLFLYCCQSFQTECSHALIQEIISVLPMHRGGSGLHPFALMDGAFAGPWPNAALFIHTIVPQTTLFVAAYMCKLILCQREALLER